MDLYRDDDTPEVAAFKSMYDAQSLKFETMTVAETQIDSRVLTEPVTEDEEVQTGDTETIPSVETESITIESQQTTSAGGGGSIGWSMLLMLLVAGLFRREREPLRRVSRPTNRIVLCFW
jgi:hypothetical protein